MKTLTKIFCSLIIFLLFLMQAFLYAQDYVGGFAFDGYNREYEVYLPQDFQANMPLVVSLHGVTETINEYKTYTVMHEVADTLGFVIVYPQGYGRSWNAGVVDTRWNYPDTDDIGFISALIDTMKSKYDIDLSRVYCCGFSLGGAMSFRMAGELGHRLAAIASVVGQLFDSADTWQPIRPLPVLHMAGTNDNILPYTGHEYWWSAQNTINYWLEKNECTIQADTISFPDIVPGDSCTIQKISYTSCSGESEVIHYKGINMGHSWPSSQTIFGKEGNKNLDINANYEILNFFKQFENPLAYGPVVFESYKFTDDTIPNPGDIIRLELKLKNNNPTVTATNIKAKLVSLDALVTASDSSLGFGDIAAGENAISLSTYTLSIDEEWPGNTVISLAIEITSDDYIFWRDTFLIMDYTNIEDLIEPVTRIYPNPTDNILNIEISNVGNQGLEIEILAVTGASIYQKEFTATGAHFVEQIDLSGYAKGIYLVKVMQANTVYVGKVVVR